MMNKFAIIFLTAAMTLGSGAAMASDDNNCQSNASAEAGAAAGGAKQNLPPKNVDNNNTGNTNTNSAATSRTDAGNMSAN